LRGSVHLPPAAPGLPANLHTALHSSNPRSSRKKKYRTEISIFDSIRYKWSQAPCRRASILPWGN
jgi:hypothetical protein